MFDPYQRFAFATLRETGARAAEDVNFQVADLRRTERLIHILGKGPGAGKPRDVPAGEEYMAEFEERCERYGLRGRDRVFFRRRLIPVGGRSGEMRWREERNLLASSSAMRRLLTEIQELAIAELEPELVPVFNLTPKVMRRTSACTALILNALGLGGLDIYSLQKAMGHSRLDTTASYLADVDEYLRGREREFNLLGGAKELLTASDH